MMITVTHATTEAQADIFINKIFGLSYSPAMKCTLIYADGGAVLPVKQSPEEIKQLINQSAQVAPSL